MQVANPIALAFHKATVSDEQRWTRAERLQHIDPVRFQANKDAKALKETQDEQQEIVATTHLSALRVRTHTIAQRLLENFVHRSIHPDADISKPAPVQYRRHPDRYVHTPFWFITQRVIMHNEEFELTKQRPDRPGPLAKWVPIPPMFGVILQTDILTQRGIQSSFAAMRTETPAMLDQDRTLWLSNPTVTEEMKRAQPLAALSMGAPVKPQLTEQEQHIPLRFLWDAENNRQQGLLELATHQGVAHGTL